MEELSYYEILEVTKTADKTTIKKAYRTMAKKYHPDKNPGDQEAEHKFKLCNEAYQCLSDEKQKSVYDRYGKEGLQGMGGGGRRQSGGFDDLGSMFEDMFSGFGGGGSRRQQNPADMEKYQLDMNAEMYISFNEAVFGCDREIEFQYKDACKPCKGTGAKDAKLSTCKQCGGQGQVHMKQGFMTFAQTCPVCNGAGSAPTDSCKSCKGKGYENKNDKVTIKIPAGIDSDNRLRVSGKGNIGKRGTRGDLYVTFGVTPDKNFQRDGKDVYIAIPVFFTQAASGDTITIPSLTGELELKLDVGTQHKQQFTFRGQGVADVHGHGKGDLIAQVYVNYPKKLNKAQKELLKELQSSFGEQEANPHESVLASAIDAMKGWFK